MAEPLATLTLMAALYTAGITTVPETRMTPIEPAVPAGGIVVAQGSCATKPPQCRTGMPANQLCKRTTAGQPAGIIWTTCISEGLPTMWKPVGAPCTCNV